MLAGAGGQHQMARPYSQDLRDRVIGSVASGRTCRATAALFGVSVASVVKWSQRWRASGSAVAKPMGGWKQLLLKSEREWLLARIAEKPDLTLRAVVGELAERGTPASYHRCGTFLEPKRAHARETLESDGESDAVDLPRFRGEMRAWDQALWLYVMLSSGSWHSLVRPRRSHSSVPTRALTRLPRAVAVKDGREHGGRLVCVAIDGCCMMPVFVFDR